MYFGASRLSVSKLKHFSNLLGCSFSSLRNSSCSEYTKNKKLFQQLGIPNCFMQSLPYSGNITQASIPQNVDINSLTKGDEELTKKLKVIMLEVEVMRQDGMRVPSTISQEFWKQLLNLSTTSQRRKLLAFLWLNEMKKINRDKKKELKRVEKEQSMANNVEEDDGHIKYGLGNNTMFHRIIDRTMNQHYNSNLFRAMLFGQDLVLDCSYDEFMNRIEAALCAKQLNYVFSENRVQREPFNIHFCNVNKDGHVFSKLHKIIPTLYDEAFPANITNKSYMELFPKERLVYLTPHCRQELSEYSHDDIYIIGAMVDKVNVDPISLAKAKALGLRMAKLPLDRYLDWGTGGKSLTLNQMLQILHELKLSGDWKKALTHVPPRKLKYDNFYKKRVLKRNTHLLTGM